jgi:phosphohistidine phosphatase
MSAQTIYFMQHGLAVDKAVDSERPLSEAGIHQTKQIANILLRSKIPISTIFHSGKLRASQTADIIASTLNVPTTSETNHLSPNDDVTMLAQNLSTDTALYVGHLPHLDKMVSYLVTGKKIDSIIKFHNSAIVCLEKNKDPYHIMWYLTPDLLSHPATE